MAEAFPLHWPEGWPRTATPQSSRFDVSFASARDGLLDELRLFGARYPVISTDIELRRDGLPYANQREPNDRGVAVYFEWNGKQRVLACDRWDKIKDNMRALEKTVEALRGIDRWGASTILERSFQAFVALPPSGKKPWREVFGFGPTSKPDRTGIELQYRTLSKTRHPDAGGSEAMMAELNVARDEALKEIGQ